MTELASRRPLHIVHVSSEMAPFAKVGGLADMVAALAREQARQGHDVLVVIPGYRGLQRLEGWRARPLEPAHVSWGLGFEPASFELLEPPGTGPRVLLVRHEGPRRFFDRAGIYDDPNQGHGHADNPERFLFFCRAALEGLKRLGRRVDVLHAHDHQAAWAPCFVRTHDLRQPLFDSVATVFTVHNLGYQGICDPFVLGLANINRELFYAAGPFEFWGRVNFMKVGLAFADVITTVSPRYAYEIQSSAEFGAGLEGVLQRRKADLHGILNGIDAEEWNPATDPHLPARYSAADLSGKAACRAALIRAAGWNAADPTPVIGMVSRLTEQKGLDLLEQGAHRRLELPARFVVQGAGEPRYEMFMNRLAEANPGRVHFHNAFDEPFAHLVGAGSDLFLMPSRYEPCGLNQMYSQRYGTPPVVRAVGGLADTVEEFNPLLGTGTGFRFEEYAPEDMVAALRRAISIHGQPDLWRRLQSNGMAKDFSWRRSADAYEDLYRSARERVAMGAVRTLERVRETA
jgi:starch synthase